MKRFTATEKWEKSWFSKLSPVHKCFWQFLCDKCDAAGVWDENYQLASFQIGAPVSDSDLDAFGDRIARIPGDKVLVLPFIEFQYGNLSRECKAHIPVFKALDKHKLLDGERVSIPYAKGIHTLQETDKEKEKETEEDSSGKRLHGIPDSEAAVIEYGKTCNPPVPESVCKAFWAYYEGQRRTSPNGNVFWITSGERVVTNWKVKLPGFSAPKSAGASKQIPAGFKRHEITGRLVPQ